MRTCKLWLGKSGVSNGRKVSTDHGFQLQMWFYATMASNNTMQQWPATMAFNCRCDFMQQWPPTADVILCNNGLQQYYATMACNNGLRQFYATMASNCRCDFTQQWPPTILCNNGLQLQM
jgi:hypothetical protein